MRNILRIFVGDLMKVKYNVIAWIMIMGLTVVPSLYAWFNIAASWDPYSNTGNLKVAVVNADRGYSGDLVPLWTGYLWTKKPHWTAFAAAATMRPSSFRSGSAMT